ncbi:MAG TPA: hypothetical protein VGQ65_02100, partial [Thermoanaerobaculia bacterium]|nr:hypothetical protein [Thermoanaerobaculia bacterium]
HRTGNARTQNDNHSKKQMRWCGIDRAPRRSPDAELTDDGLLMEVRWLARHRTPKLREVCRDSREHESGHISSPPQDDNP